MNIDNTQGECEMIMEEMAIEVKVNNAEKYGAKEDLEKLFEETEELI